MSPSDERVYDHVESKTARLYPPLNSGEASTVERVQKNSLGVEGDFALILCRAARVPSPDFNLFSFVVAAGRNRTLFL